MVRKDQGQQGYHSRNVIFRSGVSEFTSKTNGEPTTINIVALLLGIRADHETLRAHVSDGESVRKG